MPFASYANTCVPVENKPVLAFVFISILHILHVGEKGTETMIPAKGRHLKG
jgi:hypothetical protein